MPVNDMNVLQPNLLGHELSNTGLESFTANYGYGVSRVTKANPQAEQDQKSSANPAVDNLRTRKAREFGLTKQTVGF